MNINFALLQAGIVTSRSGLPAAFLRKKNQSDETSLLRFWKIRGQHFANIADGVDDRLAESFVPKMLAHFVDNLLPELFAAFFVDRLVANHGKFMGARCHEN